MKGCEMYPKERYPKVKEETGGVTNGLPKKPVAGKESVKTGRAGNGKGE